MSVLIMVRDEVRSNISQNPIRIFIEIARGLGERIITEQQWCSASLSAKREVGAKRKRQEWVVMCCGLFVGECVH